MSYEKNVNKKIDDQEQLPKKLEISVLKYFWQTNPLIAKKRDTIPRFLRNLEVFKNFSENELRILAKFLHLRRFGPNETIFNQNERGVGFYLIYNGYTDIKVSATAGRDQSIESQTQRADHIITLEKYDYFGELALLQGNSLRNATAISRQGCELLGLFKPDVEEMIDNHPLIAAKLLQSVGLIVANRLFSITKEVQELKFKLRSLEEKTNAK